MVPRTTVASLLAALDDAWAGGAGHAAAARRAGRIASAAQSTLLAGLGRGALRQRLRDAVRAVLLSVSHTSLERREPIARLSQAGVAFVPLVHDLIPATHPEYARPGDAARHLRRLATVSTLADGIIVNSAATGEALLPHLRRRRGPPPLMVAPLGLEVPPPPSGAPSGAAAPPDAVDSGYFVCVGTIEPRKNHLLLLHIWRDFAARFGPAAPQLLLIGKRGWENENIIDLLERCTLLRGLVREVGQVSDGSMAALLRGARALLFPSFAEGYGLPLAEALALGVPALASDLPALREVGGTVPDYLEPLDGRGWREAILDYADPRSAWRAAQMARLRHWQAPSWDEHFVRVDELLRRVVGLRRPAGAAAASLPLPAQAEPAVLAAERRMAASGALHAWSPETLLTAATVAASDPGVR
jgi:glycosyltransferase involved in cell wall biosynthesis